jgi:nucleotide-binding universal stress UspA family protein
MSGANAMGVVVVGVDDSDGAKAALRFALEEAKLRGARLRVVHAWTFAPAGANGLEAGSQPLLGVELAELRRGVEASVEATLRAAIPETVDVERRVVDGPAADVLVEESRTADLVVVGSRGVGSVRRLLLGSVGRQVSDHAACPVVIVPHGRRD